MRYVARIGGRAAALDVDVQGRMRIDGVVAGADVASAGADLYSVLVDGKSHEVAVLDRGGQESGLRLSVDGAEVAVELRDERDAVALAPVADAGATVEMRAPMPGLIVAVHVGEGDAIEEGTSVCTLEAMKMENELIAPRRARVARLLARAGAKVNGGELLAVLEPR